jgi:hypothetical protein
MGSPEVAGILPVAPLRARLCLHEVAGIVQQYQMFHTLPKPLILQRYAWLHAAARYLLPPVPSRAEPLGRALAARAGHGSAPDRPRRPSCAPSCIIAGEGAGKNYKRWALSGCGRTLKFSFVQIPALRPEFSPKIRGFCPFSEVAEAADRLQWGRSRKTPGFGRVALGRAAISAVSARSGYALRAC